MLLEADDPQVGHHDATLGAGGVEVADELDRVLLHRGLGQVGRRLGGVVATHLLLHPALEALLGLAGDGRTVVLDHLAEVVLDLLDEHTLDGMRADDLDGRDDRVDGREGVLHLDLHEVVIELGAGVVLEIAGVLTELGPAEECTVRDAVDRAREGAALDLHVEARPDGLADGEGLTVVVLVVPGVVAGSRGFEPRPEPLLVRANHHAPLGDDERVGSRGGGHDRRHAK